MDNLEKLYEDRKSQVTHCEDVIEQLTTELHNTQDELHASLDKVSSCENAIASIREKLKEAQNEVRWGIRCMMS